MSASFSLSDWNGCIRILDVLDIFVDISLYLQYWGKPGALCSFIWKGCGHSDTNALLSPVGTRHCGVGDIQGTSSLRVHFVDSRRVSKDTS